MEDAARAASVSVWQVQNWLHGSAEFADTLTALQRENTEESLRVLRANVVEATRLIVAALTDPEITVSQLRAAQDILTEFMARP